LVAVTCVVLLAVFWQLSRSAVRTKSATIDEPTHLAGGLVALRNGDYRIDPRTPPLAKLWAALGDVGLPVTFVRRGPLWADLSWDAVGETEWSNRTLFADRENDGVALLDRARGMMLVVGVALGAAAAAWASRLGGPAAAVVTTVLFCFDPNLIAHAPLVTSDTPVALALLGLSALAWSFGRRATVLRCVGLGLCCGAAFNVKFSGLLAGPILAALLLIRVLGPADWPLPAGRVARSRTARLAVALSAGLIAAGITVATTWACYGFRYRPARSPVVRVDLPKITAEARNVTADRPDALDRFVHWADDHHALPQPMLAGLLAQSTSVARWPAFLNGQQYDDGRVLYYPLAVLYKTPLPTLTLAAVMVVSWPLRRRWARRATASDGASAWVMTCLAVPAGLFALTALRTHVDIGIRNVLPLFPFAYVAIGCAVASAWRHRPSLTVEVVGPLLACLVVSTVSAWPDYISYFNAGVGGTRGGFAHLSDSNLDWGQDIKSLVDWQRQHPGVTLYADLFAAGDPAWQGLRCRPLWVPDADMQPRLNYPRPGPSMFAVSATHLQGMYVHPAQRPFLTALRRRTPTAVLGGTIYLFDDVYNDRM
jgi:hypothetical protein